MMSRILAIGLVCMVAAVAVAGVSTVSASGDNNTWNHGEDGMYEENNNNDFPDEEFPGESNQTRGGIVWPD